MFFIVLSLLIFIILIKKGIKDKEYLSFSLVFSFFIFVVCILLSLIFPPKYYEEAQLIDEIELQQLDNDQGNQIYVIQTEKWKYLYKPVQSKIKKSNDIYFDVVESDNCKKPVLKKYSRNTYWGFFTIGGIRRTEYVFYIPTGTYKGLYDLK